MGRTYRVGEVARRFGLTVRALHHYDERGLLVPSARSAAGYRLYGEDDLARLVEILALRALGLPLDRIAALLDRPGANPERALRVQRLAIRRQMADLAALDNAIGAALERHEATGEWAWEPELTTPLRPPRVTAALEEIVEKYYTAEDLAAFERLAAEAGPDEIAAVERAWAELIPLVRQARQAGLDPASAEAQALGARWQALVDRTFRGETALRGAVGAAYQAGAFASDPSLPDQDDFAFIAAVEAARGAP
jgi:DNA-binding transcriptional MerR regulator